MKITNKLNLPQAFVNAVTFHESSDNYSPTKILKSPRQFWLEKRHYAEIEEDVSERIWAIVGSGIHALLEKKQGELTLSEQRLECEIDGFKFVGFADLLDETGKLVDYKTTSVWSIIFPHDDWERQLNCYAYMYEQTGFEIRQLQIIAILRDWTKSKVDGNNYPTQPVVILDIPVWPKEKTYQFISDRINLFETSKNLSDNELPCCTKEEMWQDEEKYAVMKKGQKRAIKIFDDLVEAEKFRGEGQYVEIRASEPRKCENYCSARPWCNQYAKYLQEKVNA